MVAPLPPPTHGAAVVSEAVVSLLGDSAEVVNTAGSGKGLYYLLSRLGLHVRAVVRLASLRVSGQRPNLYVAGAGGAGLWYQAALLLAARLCGTATFFHHHSYAYLYAPARAMRVLVAVGGTRTTHVALCPDMRSRLQKLYPAARNVVVCSNETLVASRQPDTSRGRRDMHDPVVHLAHLSNLSVEKGLRLVLTMTTKLVRAGLPVRLHLAGPCADSASQRLLDEAERDLGDVALTYHGPLRREEVAAFFALADVFLFPSTYKNEAEPLVVLEALRAGVPVISFPVGCLVCLPPMDSSAPPPRTDDDFQRAVRSLVSAFQGDASPAHYREELGRRAGLMSSQFLVYSSFDLIKELKR